MKTSPQHNPDMEKVKELIADLRVAMMTTKDENENLVSRPMSVLEMDAEGSLWFFTQHHSPKAEQLNMDMRVNLAFADAEKQHYVSISGAARLLHDRQKIDELWTPAAKIWFPEGKEDPQLRILKVETHLAQYWDAPSGKMMQLFNMAKALVTGESENLGQTEKVYNYPHKELPPDTDLPEEELPASGKVHTDPVNLSVPFRME